MRPTTGSINAGGLPYRCATFDTDWTKCAAAHVSGVSCVHSLGKCRRNQVSDHSEVALRSPAMLFSKDSVSHCKHGRCQGTTGAPGPSCRFAMSRAPQPDYVSRQAPVNWSEHSYSTETWLEEKWAEYSSPDAHGLAFFFVALNSSLMCVLHRYATLERVWMSSALPLVRAHADWVQNTTGVVIMSSQYQGCLGPWGARPPPNVAFLAELSNRSLAAPFVTATPPWLVSGETPHPVAWMQRRLVFFGGRAPNPSASGTRLAVWRQIHDDPRATAHLHSLFCQLAAPCVDRLSFEARCTLGKHIKMPWAHLSRGPGGAGYCRYTPSMIHAMNRSFSSLPKAEYLRLASTHRFCLVIRGDFNGTPKLSETIAIGGAGGCIPVFVFSKGARFPYDTWLDYCELGYFVNEKVAQRNMDGVLASLARLGETEVVSKRAALRRARNAFVYRRNSSYEQPSAPEYLLETACAYARQPWSRRTWSGRRCEIVPTVNDPAVAMPMAMHAHAKA